MNSYNEKNNIIACNNCHDEIIADESNREITRCRCGNLTYYPPGRIEMSYYGYTTVIKSDAAWARLKND